MGKVTSHTLLTFATHLQKTHAWNKVPKEETVNGDKLIQISDDPIQDY